VICMAVSLDGHRHHLLRPHKLPLTILPRARSSWQVVEFMSSTSYPIVSSGYKVEIPPVAQNL
jgi:hypothetical protein